MGKRSQKLGNKEERCRLHLVSRGVACCHEPNRFVPYLDTSTVGQCREPEFFSTAASWMARYQRINELMFDFEDEALLFKKSWNQSGIEHNSMLENVHWHYFASFKNGMLFVSLLVICVSCQGQPMFKGGQWLRQLPGKRALLITKAAVGFDSPAKGRGARATAPMMLQLDSILTISHDHLKSLP